MAHMRDRYESLQPSMLTASVASMPRRWKDALKVPPPKNIDDIFNQQAGDGSTIAEQLGAAIEQLSTLREAIRTTSYNIPEELGSEVASAARNLGSGPWPSTAAEGLTDLERLFDEILAQLKAMPASDWNKSADAGRESLTVLALAQGVSRVAAERLAAVERLVAELAE